MSAIAVERPIDFDKSIDYDIMIDPLAINYLLAVGYAQGCLDSQNREMDYEDLMEFGRYFVQNPSLELDKAWSLWTEWWLSKHGI